MEETTPSLELTDDGSATLRHPFFGETYHSLRGAVGEARHVFIANGLAALDRDTVRILEIGFGSGLNAWVTLEYARGRNMGIDYTALELYPVASNVADRLGYTTDPLFAALHNAPWNTKAAITDSFSLTKYYTDATLPGNEWEHKNYDIIYFDAFAPDTQPEMWSPEMFARLYSALSPGGILVTYSAKGTVKQALRAAGFKVLRLPGALGKRHMLKAIKETEPTSYPKE